MTNINIRIDESLKEQAERVLSDLGMNMTTATTVFLKQVVRTNSIPFPLISRPPRSPWEEYVAHALEEANEDARNGIPTIPHEDFMKEAEDYARTLSAAADRAV